MLGVGSLENETNLKKYKCFDREQRDAIFACNFCMCVLDTKKYLNNTERSQHDFYQHAVFFQTAYFIDTTTCIKYTFYVERKNGRKISSMEESYKKILQNGRDLHNFTILHIGMERQEVTSYG